MLRRKNILLQQVPFGEHFKVAVVPVLLLDFQQEQLHVSLRTQVDIPAAVLSDCDSVLLEEAGGFEEGAEYVD